MTAAPPSPTIVYAAFGNGVPPVPSSKLQSVSVSASTSVPPAASIPPTSAPSVAVLSSTTESSAPEAPAPPVRIMVVGDSVGQTVGRGIERWAARTGEAVVNNRALGLCAIGRGGVIQLFDAGTLNQRGCVDWPRRWGIERFRPDVVVVLSTLWEVAPRNQPGWDGVRRFGDPDYDRWLRSEYLGLTAYMSSGGARVVWLTVPCAEHAPSRDRFWSDGMGEAAAIVRLNRLISSLPPPSHPRASRSSISLLACVRRESSHRGSVMSSTRAPTASTSQTRAPTGSPSGSGRNWLTTLPPRPRRLRGSPSRSTGPRYGSKDVIVATAPNAWWSAPPGR